MLDRESFYRQCGVPWSRRDPWENMKFTIIDCLDNCDALSQEQIDDEFLKKENMWIRKLLTYHHCMNSSHYLKRTCRSEREVLN